MTRRTARSCIALPLLLGATTLFVTACNGGPGGFVVDAAPDEPVTGDSDRPDATVPRDGDAAPMDMVIVPIDAPPAMDVPITPVDGSGVYEAGIAPDAPNCALPDGGTCRMPSGFGCVDREICDDGLDNNCNGRVDEGCLCVPGRVQRCFAGPPERRGVGACQDGMQTCQGSGEFGCWGECNGGITPSNERCDNADNNCDGCVDNGLCCRTLNGTGPSGPDDPRTPIGRPFTPYVIRGRNFYMGTAAGTSFRWHVDGGPCDLLLFATSRKVSYTLNGNTRRDSLDATGEDLTIIPTLSGDYRVRLSISGVDGLEYDCVFLVRIRAEGVRFELCSDVTGTTDIDFWVHNPNNQGPWTMGDTTCYYGNCRNGNTLAWGYSTTPAENCPQTGAGGMLCSNPRLDVDSIRNDGVPENINVDNPNDGDEFRVAANYFSGSVEAHPMVNVYCGGQLVGTYGGATVGSQRFGSTPITGFNRGGSNASGSLWRVVDVLYHNRGGVESCDLTPIIRAGSQQPCVETNTDRTYNGMCCARQSPPLPPGTGTRPVGMCM